MKLLINLKYIVAVLVASLFLFACSKEESVSIDGQARVAVAFESVNEVETSIKMNAASGNYVAQQVTVPFNDDFELVATLQTQSASQVGRKVYTHGNAASATTSKTVLPNGTLYRVVVYDQSENYVADRVYKVGEPITNVFLLDGGKTYTFLAYSVNSKDDLPSLSNQQKLANVNLVNLNGSANLMFFKRVVTVKGGENNVSLVMRNLFSQITTTIDANAVGVIDECSALISPHYGTVNVRLKDSTITYLGSTLPQNLSFSGFNTKKIVSAAAVLNHPETTNGMLTIKKIKAGGTTRENLVVNNLEITPGVKYNLNLTLSPKNGISLGGHTWAPGNLVYNKDGSYGFAANQGVYGDHWEANGLYPVGTGAGSYGGGTYRTSNDPCERVTSHGGNWRTPTMKQMQAITGVREGDKPMFMVTYSPTTQRASYKGVGGTYIGINRQPDPGTEDNYIFLPYAGESVQRSSSVYNQGGMGTYWTSTYAHSENFERFQFNTGNYSWWEGQSQNYKFGGSIRCVKK